MVTIALAMSCGPERSVRVSSFSTTSRSPSNSFFNSSETSSPSCASSKNAPMSSLRRARSWSVDKPSSRRLRSRITFWEFSGSDQKFGSFTFFSTSSSWARNLGASKILPELAHLVLQRGILLFKLFQHVLGFHLSLVLHLHFSSSRAKVASFLSCAPWL